MTSMTALRDILNDTAADATDVEFNFNTIEAFIANNLVNADGTTAMTAPLSLVSGDPVSDDHAASKGYVDSIIPTGVTLDYLGTSLEAEMVGKWLICDGSVVSQATYPNLFALFGTRYNTSGEGGTQFRLPDFRRRVAVGYDSTTSPFNAMTAAGVGGQADTELLAHTHTGPSHTHTGPSHTHTASASNETATHTHSGTSLSTSTTGSHLHNQGSGVVLVYFVGGSSSGAFGTGGTWAPTGGWGSNGDNGNHSHSISGSTGGQSVNHTHTVTVDAGGTGNTGSSGTGATGSAGAGSTLTNKNYPPFYVVTKIVKV